ncbi:MAG: S41 family peptidase [Acidobacteriota bacterium]|nr:S41 family peptidase [Acidobacteriota bacterium]
MSFRTKFFFVILSASIALYSFVGGYLATRAQQSANDAGAQLRIFENVLRHIQEDYVDEPNLEKVRAGAMRGLTKGLDPYSSYLTPEQVRDYQAKKSNGRAGIGAELSQVASYLYVIAPIKGGPAEKAGLQAGDVIEYIENKATRDLSLYNAKQMVLGDPGTKVKLRVLRAGARPQTIEVVRGVYKTPLAESRIEQNGKIGILKVNSLEDGEAADIKARLQDLQKQGVSKVVLDLRGVAIGNLQEAVNVANLFIKDGTLAQTLGRENKVVKTYTADPAKAVWNGQVVALVDFGTAGAAEVVAGAILDRKRGEVVGERTFGAGAEQQLFTLRDGDGLLLTTVKWASANGNPFLTDERKTSGVKPSVEVKPAEKPEPLDPEELEDQEPEPQASPEPTPAPTPKVVLEDVQLNKALDILRGAANAAKAE